MESGAVAGGVSAGAGAAEGRGEGGRQEGRRLQESRQNYLSAQWISVMFVYLFT